MNWRLFTIMTITFLILAGVARIGFVSVRDWWRSKYDRENFNCVDMSYFLATMFHLFNFDASIVYGHNKETGHAWLSINSFYFDSTNLWFDSEKEYTVDFVDGYPYGYYDEKEKGMI